MYPPGKREGVDAIVADEEEVEAKVTVVRVARELSAEGVDVLGELRILDDDAGIAQLQHHAAPELVLAALAQRGVGRGAEIRELVVGRRRRGQSQHHCEEDGQILHDSDCSV